jgi:ribonucleoside-diphosphate reductase beta chain
MGILDRRIVYAPFEFQWAYDLWLAQQSVHWLAQEIPMTADVADWEFKLTDSERNVIGNTLKGFTQAELLIEDYWGSKVAKWFPKPEIAMMASTFGAFESIHAVAYAYLNQTLNLENYEAFLLEPTAKAKIDRLMDCEGNTPEEIALSLAVFSAFNEGVSLFSSFAVLMNFSRFNKLKGVGQIVAYSIRDESLHSSAGCRIFNQLIAEYPRIWTKDLKAKIYDAARLTIQLEDAFIDKVFEMGEIEGISSNDLKQYLRYRCNTKLQDIGLKSNWKNINKDAVKNLEWFSVLSQGTEMADFFATKVTSYTKGALNFSQVAWN